VAAPRLFRVILPVSDIDAAAEWYGRVLGVPGSRVSPNRHYFDCGGTILAVRDVTMDPAAAPFRPNPDHIYVSVTDLAGAHTRVREAGANDLTDIATQPWRERSFYARDPFGNPICFVDAGTLFTG